MLFEVTRASSWGPETKPHDKCIPIKLMLVDTRRCRSAEEFDKWHAYIGEKWYSAGSNHRLDKNGYITRDLGEVDRWGIEINTFEELMTFKEEIGEDLILGTSYTDHKTPMITIYDDYIE